MNILGVDFGFKTVGLALLSNNSDGSFLISPLPSLSFNSTSRIANELLNVCRLYDAATIVFGHPRPPNGREGTLSRSIKKLSENILAKNKKIKIFFADESLTSRAAREDPAYFIRPRSKRRGWEGSLSACLILENYLASSKASLNTEPQKS
ncbi:MAG: Holliday junction resolvase RuvX [Patescibacteria group bacterium]|nr:Holliday junction resolvase RuvX [Patescibacteria group bacterium]